MTVAELIDVLRELPQDAQVYADSGSNVIGRAELAGDEVVLLGLEREAA